MANRPARESPGPPAAILGLRAGTARAPASRRAIAEGKRSKVATPARPSALLIKYGVNSVVIAETATAIGYRKSLVTFRVTPSDAMMKENSPICANPMPTRREVRVSLPPTKAPKEQASTLPTITASVITTARSCRKVTECMPPAAAYFAVAAGVIDEMVSNTFTKQRAALVPFSFSGVLPKP